MIPEPGWVTPAKIVRVIDGDTVDVEVKRTIRVRLIDCWAPEVHGPEREVGEKSKAHLESLLPASERIVVQFPTQGYENFIHLVTLGRLLGRIYVPAGDVAEMMIAAGMAQRQK